MKYLKYLVFFTVIQHKRKVESIAARHDPDPVWNNLKQTRQYMENTMDLHNFELAGSPFQNVTLGREGLWTTQTTANSCCILCQFIYDKLVNYGPDLWSVWGIHKRTGRFSTSAVCAVVHKRIMYAFPLKKGQSWNRVSSINLLKAIQLSGGACTDAHTPALS